MTELQWRELVEKTKKGDKNAFESLYKETNRSVYFTALKLLANEENAKDITQDTFMTAIAKLNELEDGAKFPQWVNRIAVNKCKMYFRKTTDDSLDEQTEQGFEPKDDDSFIPEEYVEDEAKRKLIMDMIQNTLSDVQRQSIIMYYYDEMSLEEISEVMGCPLKTVSSRLVSAREKLREAVLIYEKKNNDRLHMLLPVPILTQILRKEAAKISVPDIPLSVFTGALSDAAASASANILTTSEIAGGSKMTGILTGKVIAAIAAGVIAVGGAAAIVFSKKSDKDTRPEESTSASVVTEDSNADDTVDDDKNDDGNDSSAMSEIVQSSGKVIKYGDNNFVILPPNYEKSDWPHNNVSVYCDPNTIENPYYGLLTVSSCWTDEEKKMNTAEIREYFINNKGYGHNLLDSLHNDLFMAKANVEKTETITIKGKEFIKESGTLTLSNFTDEFPAVYSALFGKLDFIYDSGKAPENDVPIAFLAVSMNNTDVMKQEMITNIDNLAKGLAMTDESEAEKFAESLTTDQRSFFTEGASFTAPNGTRGNMRKTGPFNILQPEYWWFTKSTEFGDAVDPSEIAMKSFDGSKYMYVNYYSSDYDPEKWANEKAEFLKTQPEFYEDISAVPAFTSGNFKWGVVKYKTEAVHGQPWEWSFIASGVSTDGSENCVQIKLVGLDYESDIAQDILATVDAAKGGVQ